MVSKTKQTEFKGLSTRVKSLLNLQEGYDVEFKKTIDGLEVEDLVAFANSDNGGAILIGVEEIKNVDGQKTGKGNVVGCKVNDEIKRKIVEKAESCVPPVEIAVFVESLSQKPFYRIEIPSGTSKPYATFKGVYKVRGDGRTSPLLPSRLLTLYLEIETQKFINNFRSATHELEKSLLETTVHLTKEMQAIVRNITRMGLEIENRLEGISDDVENAQDNSDEANSEIQNVAYSINETQNKIQRVEDTVDHVEMNVLQLLRHYKIEDERERRRREEAIVWFEYEVRQIRSQNPKISKKKLIEELSKSYPQIPIPDLTEYYNQIINSKQRTKENSQRQNPT